MTRTSWTLLALWLPVGCAHAPPLNPQAEVNNAECAHKLAARDLDAADSFCDHAIELSPQYPDVWVNKGLIAYQRGKRDDAREAFTKAAHLNGELARAHNGLGILAMEDGKHGDAEGRFRRALQLNPDYVDARFNLVLDAVAARQLDRAKKELNVLTTAHPNLADAWHLLGTIRLREGGPGQAVELFKQALELDPRRPTYWNGLGVGYARLLRYEDAEYALQSCLEVAPNDTPCQQNLDLARARSELALPEVLPKP